MIFKIFFNNSLTEPDSTDILKTVSNVNLVSQLLINIRTFVREREHCMDFDRNLTTKVAWYYYMEKMTQEQIADYFGISRFKVIKLLDQARNENIVQFRIKGNGVNCLKIEQDLKRVYKISDTVVIPKSPKVLTNSLALAASQYLEDKIKDNDIIAFGWGQTVSMAIGNLRIDSNLHTSFVSLTGGVKYYLPFSDNASVGSSSNSKLHVMPAPFYLSTEEMANNTKMEPSVKIIIDLARMANYYLVGIGPITNEATVIKENVITAGQMEILKRKGAVGDILGQFYDSNGNKLDAEIHTRIMSFDIDNLKEKGNVIAVAGGSEKIQAIKSALKGGYVDILITDEETAEQLIQ